jgi:DNA-binding transcriptional regulator YdaS (Cro superfamily)
MSGKNRAAALAAWAAPAPDWVLRLAEEADATSQVRAGERLGLSPSTVNAVIRGRYGAKTDQVERVVRGKLMDAKVVCPELGPTPLDVCHDHQARAGGLVDTGSFRARMRRACKACPLSRFSQDPA